MPAYPYSDMLNLNRGAAALLRLNALAARALRVPAREHAMTDTPTIDKIAHWVDRTVTLSGWLYNKRTSKNLAFLEIRDGTGIMQAVVSKKDVGESTWAAAEQLTQESSFHITGIVKKHPKLPEYWALGEAISSSTPPVAPLKT